MVGTGSRLFFALATIGLLGAVAFGLASGGDPVGVLSLGYKGGVGEHFSYALLTAFGVTALGLGFVSAAIRDADPDATAALSGVEALPEVPAPNSTSPWPLVGAVGLVITALGLVVGAGYFMFGLVILAVTTVEWAVRVWADRATGDPEVNRAIRNRLMAPFEVPVAAVIVIAFLVLGLSRVFLAVSSTGAWVIGTLVAFLIVLGAVVVLTRPQQTKRLATALLLILTLAVLGGGIAGVVAGEREFHHEEPAHESGG
jgi:hypothetical protein